MTIAVTAFDYKDGKFTVEGTGPGPVEVQVDNGPARQGESTDVGWSAVCELKLDPGTHTVVVTLPGTDRVVKFTIEVKPPPPS